MRRLDAAAIEGNALRVAAGDLAIKRNLDTHAFQRAPRIIRQCFRKCRQQARTGLDQNDTRGPRIDATEVVLQSLPRHLRDGAGHFHASGAAADNDESEQARSLGLVLHHFRTFEGEQKSPPDLGRIGDVL